MSIKRDSFGKAIDHYTNTVADAAAFEAYYNSEPDDRPSRGEFMDDEEEIHHVGQACPVCATALEEEEEQVYCPGCKWSQCDEEEEEDPCMCSDPCCPCSGSKRGVP